jgi:tRNA-dihydrouridine synthase A
MFLQLVGECMTAIAEGSPGTPVTVKCRIGVDDFDSYDLLRKYLASLVHVVGRFN